MSIQQINGNRMTKTTESIQPLRTGQIVQGKIIKLFPNNKAQIQLGSRQLVAQLEASLTVGSNYHFQVKATDSLIHLRVLGHQLQQKDRLNTLQLLEQLGFRTTNTNISFVQLLLKEKIPFDRGQLAQALQLFEGAGNHPQAVQIIKGMIQNRLPLSDSVFQALLTKNTNNFSEAMKSLSLSLHNGIQKTDLQQNLLNRLTQLTVPPMGERSGLVKQIVSDFTTNSPSVLNVLKAAGGVSHSVEFSQWKDSWEAFMKQKNVSTNLLNSPSTTEKLPYQLQSTEVNTRLEHLAQNKHGLQAAASELLQKWERSLSQAINRETPMTNQSFEQIRNDLTKNLSPLLQKDQQIPIQNTGAALRQLFTQLQTLSNELTFRTIDQILTNLSTPKDQFLSQLNQVLSSTGLSYESSIGNENPEKQLQTIKSMLIQMIQQTDGAVQDNSRQLLHYINGMQLQSVNETMNILQANLTIPAEKLGLAKDIQLEFEGKKTESGEINPDFCRILFYLELANVKETIIDMYIQKRAVSITIFNDHLDISNLSNPLKPLLRKGLEGLDYQLSTISFKPLKQNSEPQIDPSYIKQPLSYQGVDYRI
ncbi:hypothetical protein ACFSTA_05950 [Ornithinibacillus salinisoli]|uniref:Flagellar hook-length control protein FliK n=1 Tax=Ornithinibacillus salinisoli TaxID=1848459 RepID=A0ABW4VZ74_9BACI